MSNTPVYSDSSTDSATAAATSTAAYKGSDDDNTYISLQSRKFLNVNLTQEDIENILLRATNSHSLDISGADLSHENALILSKTIIFHRFYSFTSINANNTRLASTGFDTIVNAAIGKN